MPLHRLRESLLHPYTSEVGNAVMSATSLKGSAPRAVVGAQRALPCAPVRRLFGVKEIVGTEAEIEDGRGFTRPGL
jgi:hypothetical protein